MKRWNRIIWCGVFGLLIVAGLVGRFFLWDIGFEFDEIFTAITSDPRLSWMWMVQHWLIIDVHPPLHNFILYLWNHIAPYGPEVWLRLPSLFFSLASLILAWCFFPKRWGKEARLLFVALLATNGYCIIYAQHARAYALILLFSVPLTFLFLKMSRLIWHRKSIPLMQWGLFGVFSLLLSWTHYFGALLFGVFSVLLFVQAWYYKQKLLPFILVPLGVTVLFLPWLIPNFLANMHLQRFGGDWWANVKTWKQVPNELTVFFFTSYIAEAILACLVLWGLGYKWFKHRSVRQLAYRREICLLLVSVAAVMGIVALASLKIYLLMGRYFMELLPAFYLLLVLCIAPLFRKYNIVCLALSVALFMALWVYYEEVPVFNKPTRFPARIGARWWQQYFPGQELLVASISGFPVPAMEKMYGFYLNEIWKENIPVRELYNIPQQQREALLAQRPYSMIYMPNCSERDLNQLARSWKRNVWMQHRLGLSCFVSIENPGYYWRE